MDLLMLITEILISILLILFLYRLFRWAKYGGAGEWKVANWYLSPLSDEYALFNDLLIESDDGSTHQIDHVIVSPYGIFVLETKGYMGKVYGGQYSKEWTEYIGGKGYDFYNPIRQNHGHVKALEELLGLPNKAFISIIVFGRSAQLKMDIDEKVEVVKTPQLLETIRSYSQKLISKKTQKEIKDILRQANIKDKSRRIQHVQDINRFS